MSASEVLLRPRTSFLLDTAASVPGLTRRAVSVIPVQLDGSFAWQLMGALYEIGPELGQVPDWIGNETWRTLHSLRGSTATVPNGALWLRRASAELIVGDTTAARAAWRVITRIDPMGASALLSRFGGDTLQVIGGRKP